MDIRDLYTKYRLDVKGLIQVGSFTASEYEPFKEIGATNFIFIDANPEVIPQLKNKFGTDCKVLNHLISDKDGDVYDFNIANHVQSSSMLEFDKHKVYHPNYSEVVKVLTLTSITLDTLVKREKVNMQQYNCLMMDVQGAEMMVLRGFNENLNHIDYIYTELNFDSMYKGCYLEPEFTAYLAEKGYTLVESFDTGHGWGDGLYIKQSLL